MKTSTIERRHAAGVAGVATLIGIVTFVLVAIVANLLVLGRFNSQLNSRLEQELTIVQNVAKEGGSNATHLDELSHEGDRDDVPIYVWRVSANGTVQALKSSSPKLPSLVWSTGVQSASVGQSHFQFRAVRFRGGWLVAGESLAEVSRVRSSLVVVEVAAGGVLLILIYLAAFVIGMRALTPVALARRRQAAFTSDASHELRTPLSVIEAEVDLALSRPRDAATYQGTLSRVREEGQRLQHIVEDLLWLARSDEVRETVDQRQTCELADVVSAAESRFERLATRNDVALEFVLPTTTTLIRASSQAVDRLVGVLVDNACKFAGPGGRVNVQVQTSAHRLSLIVEDSGPGISKDERDVIFDRFHRTDEVTGGTGLGLAIADAIILATHAHRTVGESTLGGARFEVSWRHAS
ncbi:MAG TPA: HAMP domain-containing sensor histidine kinase [Acidimicrobiales bacterium]